MKGKKGEKCKKCGKGTYQETSIHSDLFGEYKCNKCGHAVTSRSGGTR